MYNYDATTSEVDVTDESQKTTLNKLNENVKQMHCTIGKKNEIFLSLQNV